MQRSPSAGASKLQNLSKIGGLAVYADGYKIKNVT